MADSEFLFASELRFNIFLMSPVVLSNLNVRNHQIFEIRVLTVFD